jgi:5'-nucleotidase
MDLSILWLLQIVVVIAERTTAFEVVILHTNDIHARIEETNKYGGACGVSDAKNALCFGGAARRKAVVDAERAASDHVVLLDAGDQFQGTTWFTYYDGRAAGHFMNLLGYDAMVSAMQQRYN